MYLATPQKNKQKHAVQILTITITLGIDLSKRLFLVQHGFSSSWTPLPCHKHGQKKATNCCLQEAIVNGLWTLNRFERVYGIWVFPCTGTGLTATKYCLEMGLNRFERQFLGQGIPNGISQIPEVSWGIVGFDIQIQYNSSVFVLANSRISFYILLLCWIWWF